MDGIKVFYLKRNPNYGKLNDIEHMDSRFYRCHKGYLINLQHIKTIDKKNRTVTMQNDIVCPLSFRAIYKVQSKMDYWFTENSSNKLVDNIKLP